MLQYSVEIMELSREGKARGFEVIRHGDLKGLKPGYMTSVAVDTAKRYGIRNGSALNIACGALETGNEVSGSGFFGSVDTVLFNTASLVSVQGPGKLEDILSNLKDLGKYDAIFVNNMFEFLNGENKQLFLDRISGMLNAGGVLAMSFPTSLPEDFVQERLKYRERSRMMPLVGLFRDSDAKRSKSLPFESGMVEMMEGRGWQVLKKINFRGERNFVAVQEVMVVLKKPENSRSVKDV